MNTALVWFRRDLRLIDNPALAHAYAHATNVVPVFLWTPDEEAPWQPGAASRWWLHHSLKALSNSLERAGAPLIVRSGASALLEIKQLVADTGADAVFWNRLYDPSLVRRDETIKQALREDGLEVDSFNASLLLEPWTAKSNSGVPYRVFTPFWNAMRDRIPARTLHSAPSKIARSGKKVGSATIDALGLLPRVRWDTGLRESWCPGESGALDAADALFGERIANYREDRDRLGATGTSRLSPHLHFGEIGPNQLVVRAQRHAAEHRGDGILGSVETFLKELGWREFAHHLLFHFPRTTMEPLDGRFAYLEWRSSSEELARWQRGMTGIPIVDAGMRELWHTGWMHNRVRMIVASFLTKNLLMRWQEGARWFWDTLVDADLANNTLGWQWSAGCGADAAPYFRIFNPELQAQKFDPDSTYVRRWASDAIEPMVDLKASRARALETFKALKR